MKEILVLDNKTVVNFKTREIRVNGKQEKSKLSKTHLMVLKWLVDAYPGIAYFADYTERSDGHRDWTLGNAHAIRTRINELGKICGLGDKKITKRKDPDVDGYQFNPEIDFEWKSDFALETLHPEDIFHRPEQYIEPEAWLEDLYANAFRHSKVHVISGERGLGKTDLTRCFAEKCTQKDCRRSDLNFSNVIFTSYSQQGLKETITLLKCVGESEEKESFEQKINLLKHMEKPALLIIDNYDNEDRFREELSEESGVYRILCDTGCHILITSKINMANCYGLYQTKLRHFSSEVLLNLFFALAEEEESREKAVDLIENYLLSNTYLVRLAAGLMQTRTIDELIRSLQSLRINEITDPIYGRDYEEKTIFEHFSALFDLSDFAGNKTKCRILYTLSLLPSEGIRYTDYFEMAFSAEEQAEMQSMFHILKDAFWVFLKHRKVSLHPVVREMIARKGIPFQYEYIKPYVDALNVRLYFKSYMPEMTGVMKMGVAACEILDKMQIENLDTAGIFAKLSSNYDILGNKELTYQYGIKAYQILEQVEEKRLDEEQLYSLALAYNLMGYAVLHVYGKKDSMEYAEKALLKASEILQMIQADNKKKKRLFTANQGDLAALNIVKKDYQKAFQIHCDNVAFRKELLEEEPEQDYKKMVAASYKGMATALFYLSREHMEQRELLLQKSYQYHCRSVEYYEKAYAPDYHFDRMVEENRCIGTLCQLLEYLPEDELRTALPDALERMNRAVSYSIHMDTRNEGELQNSLNNVKKLLEKMWQENLVDEVFFEKYAALLKYAGVKWNRSEINNRKEVFTNEK